MTLILTIANTAGIFQTSDYQLTNAQTGTPFSDHAGSKQLQASFGSLQVHLAFTGVASLGTGPSGRTVDFLAEELKGLPSGAGLQKICEALSGRCAAAMKPLGTRGVLTLVLAAAEVGEPYRVAVISNSNWQKSPPQAKDHFTITIETISKPFHLISGFRDAVPEPDRHRLEALSRDSARLQNEILNELKSINVAASKRSEGWISEGCWATAQVADANRRDSTTQNFGGHPGSIPSLLSGFDLAEFVRKNFRAAPGKEISLVQTAGAYVTEQGAVPVPEPEGEPRTFLLSGPSVTGWLTAPAGARCASLEVTQLQCAVTARRNEEITTPFARIGANVIASACSDFARPLFPWPTLGPGLSLDGAPIPEGWQYSVGYWIENEVHHIRIPQSSRAIRNLAFLGSDDELVIVAPTTEIAFDSKFPDQPQPTMVEARIWWRTRLDGTRD